ncbi:hypothetical protein [Daejeonella sp.]|uniref:hypothetical protein n=1 Tax=Daejeonella sp. TaxID=2805397 RepID=UPI003982FA91
MNNQSKKSEKLVPQDSEQKKVEHPKDDNEAVVKRRDKVYNREDANFADPAKRREIDEQPVTPIKSPPKD